MLMLAMVAAFNPAIRRAAVMVLAIGHAIAVLAQLWLYLMPNNHSAADHQFLLTGIISDAVVILVSVIIIIMSKPQPRDKSRVDDVELRSPATSVFRGSLLGVGIFCAAYAVAIVFAHIFASPDKGLGAVFGGPDPLIANTVTRYAAIALICFLLFSNAGLRRYLLPPMLASLSVGAIVTFVFALMGKTTITTQTGVGVSVPWFAVAQVAIDGGLLMLILALRKMQYEVDYQITSLNPTSAECVMAAHEAFREVDQNPAASSREVLHRIDEHIAEIHGRNRGLLAFPFWILEQVFTVLCGLRPPFSTMSRDEQRFMLRKYILRPNYERDRSLIAPLANLFSQIGEAIHSLLSLAYFTTARAHAQVGYVLPDARERLQPDIAYLRPPEKVEPARLPLDFNDPVGKKPLSDPAKAAEIITPRVDVSYNVAALPDEVDYCIIGSGAAGGVLAYRLAEAVGNSSSICVLERGGYASPRQDFSDDELRMLRLLYAEGGLQMTRTFDFVIAQGETVGGTTVINNAICLQMPDSSKKEWASFGFDANLLNGHYSKVQTEINIDVLKDEAVNHRVEGLFARGVAEYNKSHGDPPLRDAERLKGNFSNCLGCGLCHIGCKRMRKLSVLETYLAWAQARGVMVYSNVEAIKCETEKTSGGVSRMTSVVVRTQTGEFRKIRIRKAAVVAGGAIASSRFLMRSEVGGDGVGNGVSCNYAFPTLVEFEEIINAFDGVQITMFAAPESFEAVFETTYNPPGTYSISLPVYFRQHAEMMRAYTRATNFGVLVGSDPSGTVSRNRDLVFGRAIDWNQTKGEIERIKRSLVTLVRIAKGAGAKRIILPTRPALIIPLESDVEKTLSALNATLSDKRYFNFYTAHPQGGNMLASESHNDRVVNTDFRVRDCENLFVCDASVFPRGIRVNPQWTIMALASLAAKRIAEA